MRRFIAVLVLTLSLSPNSSIADDKKEARSLADDAAYLAEKSGKNGWVSAEVTVSMDDGKKKAKGKLLMHFKADKGKATGSMSLGIDHGTTAVGSKGEKFELVEKDGKRSIRIMEGNPGKDKDADPKVLATLEYTIEGDKLMVKDGVIRKTWAGWDVDLTKAVSFKAAGK